MGGTGRKILLATLVAGTLDILSACVYTLAPIKMLKGLASAVAGKAAVVGSDWFALLGLALHFAIMAVMAAFFVIAANRMPVLKRHWLIAGVAYGIGLWAVMNLIVLPLRFGSHPFTATVLAEQFFSHIVLVGIPIAWFARR
jgi:uncharacterized membrane protein YagU involved in acid resistance